MRDVILGSIILSADKRPEEEAQFDQRLPPQTRERKLRDMLCLRKLSNAISRLLSFHPEPSKSAEMKVQDIPRWQQLTRGFHMGRQLECIVGAGEAILSGSDPYHQDMMYGLDTFAPRAFADI